MEILEIYMEKASSLNVGKYGKSFDVQEGEEVEKCEKLIKSRSCKSAKVEKLQQWRS